MSLPCFPFGADHNPSPAAAAAATLRQASQKPQKLVVNNKVLLCFNGETELSTARHIMGRNLERLR